MTSETEKAIFEELRAEILRRAREAKACREQYGRAYASESVAELLTVVKDNFDWACGHNVLDVQLIEKYREVFAVHDIRANVDASSGYLLCDGCATVRACGSATVRACGSATVLACGSATVQAYGGATVEACGSATVRACDSATVRACDSAYVTSYKAIECKLSGNAIYRVCGENKILYASDGITFEKIQDA